MNNLSAVASTPSLGQEWVTLQNNYEQYERTALLIKLMASVFAAIGWFAHETMVAIALIAVLWLQEGIFKTYQSRLGVRLIRIEALLKQPDAGAAPFQLHTEWAAGRQGVAGLLAEYAASAARPTVAFPYAVLLLLAVAQRFA
jgi:hypothetical protein